MTRYQHVKEEGRGRRREGVKPYTIQLINLNIKLWVRTKQQHVKEERRGGRRGMERGEKGEGKGGNHTRLH